jgi:uncharacterized protein (TIGR02444 family)
MALQDRRGLDVDMLFFCLFAGSRGRTLGDNELKQLEACIAPWRENVLRPTRHVRRWLKDQSLLPKQSVDALRRGVLTHEIQAESLQQRLMETQIEVSEAAPDVRAAGKNLVRYLALTRASVDDQDLGGLALLLSQAFPMCSPAEAHAILQGGAH